ncbi:unnamed protein product, partial [Staurois parvus]
PPPTRESLPLPPPPSSSPGTRVRLCIHHQAAPRASLRSRLVPMLLVSLLLSLLSGDPEKCCCPPESCRPREMPCLPCGKYAP